MHFFLILSYLILILNKNSISTATSISFEYTGAIQTFVVPNGVTSLSVTATGASGADFGSQYPGGFGSKIQATLSVVPRATYYLLVGGAGFGNTKGYNGGGEGSGVQILLIF
jgi:hypothetical protein